MIKLFILLIIKPKNILLGVYHFCRGVGTIVGSLFAWVFVFVGGLKSCDLKVWSNVLKVMAYLQ